MLLSESKRWSKIICPNIIKVEQMRAFSRGGCPRGDFPAARQGPSFRDAFVANFMTNFSDDGHAAELARFAPAQATSGGRVMTARALETIAISADLKTRALPAIDAWIRERNGRRP
jgi:hypothetical protein